MKPLHKTVIVIWTEDYPSEDSLEDLARAATSGDAYCSLQKTTLVPNPAADDDWDGTEFFVSEDEG